MIRKLLFSIFAIIFSIAAISQQQPENPGFENWENVPTAGEEPTEWSSIKSSDNSLLNGLAPVVWEKTTDSHNGTFGIKLFNEDAILGTVPSGIITNGRIHSEIVASNAYAYTDVDNSQWNTSLIQRPDSVVVWAKFSPLGTDTAQLRAIIHTDYAQLPETPTSNWIGLASINIPDEVTNYTRYSAPFNYFNNNTPEFILIVLNSGGTSATTGSAAYFDDVAFVYNPILLDLKVFLEGPYAGSSLMNTGLNPDHIPLAQPYNTTPWNYAGTESVTSIPNSHVVDWVMIELRDAPNAASATSSTIIGRQAGFVLDNGSIRGLEGNNKIRFDNLFNYDINDNLYVVIHHRNHLSVMSADALIKANGEYAYNFTDDVTKTYGGAAGCKLLSTTPDVWGMVSGDGDGNGTVNDIDKTSFWSILTGKSGYLSGDYNMDSQTNNQDKNEVWLDNNTKASQVPN